MLIAYKKKANAAAAVWLLTMFILLALMAQSPEHNIWESRNVLAKALLQVLLITCGIAYWYALWAYAKGKGYSGWLGAILPIFSVVGLIILAKLPDKHKNVQQEL